jgi:hypothetical protein
MTDKQWQQVADAIQEAGTRLSRSLIVGHLTSIVFLWVGTMIPEFPIDQLFILQFALVCISLGLTAWIAAVNYMFTLSAIKQRR